MSYWHLYPAGIGVPTCPSFHLPHNSVSSSFILFSGYFNDLILFKLATTSQHLHNPQSIFYVMFEILHFRCDFEDKEEVHACLLADLIWLMLPCFACQSALQSTTSLPISYPIYYLYTSLCYCFLGSSSAAESLCISSYMY